MDKIEASFNAKFANWSICLPSKNIAQRKRGKVIKAGWAIWYLFGSDASGEYLDYYASHRMTNDRHIRIHSDGRCESLPVFQDFRVSSEDPEEDARLDAEYYAEAKRVAELLEAKGFGLQGDEPGGVQMRRCEQMHKLDESEEDC